LNATSITTGAHGYVQNVFAALHKESDKEEDDVQTVIMQMAALTTQSQITAATAAATSASLYSSNQSTCGKPTCYPTTVCCIHCSTQHNLPACASSTATHYAIFDPKLCNVPYRRA
jgi:hypothetical protein